MAVMQRLVVPHWGYHLEIDPDPIAMMVITVELFTLKPSETNLYKLALHVFSMHDYITGVLLSAGLVDE